MTWEQRTDLRLAYLEKVFQDLKFLMEKEHKRTIEELEGELADCHRELAAYNEKEK